MGETTDIKFNITIKVVSGSITVIAVDSEKKDRLEIIKSISGIQGLLVDIVM